MQTNTKKSWFKQFWPWFLILLPMTVVVASITTLVIATNNKPEMVVDDYYQTGKATNVDLSRLKKALQLGISALVSQQKNGLRISFNGLKSKASISFSLYHSTQSKRDKIAMLTADAKGDYYFKTEESLDGKWTLRLESFDKQWRLEKKIEFPTKHITL